MCVCGGGVCVFPAAVVVFSFLFDFGVTNQGNHQCTDKVIYLNMQLVYLCL